MNLSNDLKSVIEEKLTARISAAHTVTGGCISETARLDLQSGEQVFLKWAQAGDDTPGLFRAEAASLRAIARTKTVRVPRVVDVAEAIRGYSFLLLEWLEPGRSTSKSWAALGFNLAALHQQRASEFGWSENNFIGALPQSNRVHKSWADFWRVERLQPQLQNAHAYFSQRDRANFDELLDKLDELLSVGDQEGASLLHGDLWNGNVHMMADGSAAVIDPSSYYGHREVDLAMSKLFGGFAREFYDAYEKAWPLEPGAERRMQIYQLYYLLVHVNLFGTSYVPNTLSVLRQLTR